MKLFFFLVAAFLVAGTSAQNNSISGDLQRIFNRTDAQVDAFVTDFVNDLRGAANNGLSLLSNFWNGVRSGLLEWFGVTSPAFVSLVDRALNVTVQTFAIDYSASWLRNVTITNFQDARALYNEIFQQYIGTNSTAYNVYQCWNASRSQVAQVLGTFINSTFTLSRPSIAEFRNVTTREFNTVMANFTSYRLQVIRQCPVYLIFRVAACRNQFVNLNL